MEKDVKFNASYESNSYVLIGKTIKLIFSCEKKVEWVSLNDDIATVENGIVFGKNKGNAIIKVKSDDFEYDFYVTVLSGEENDLIKALVKNHNSNLFFKKNFDGLKTYSVDIIESVNKILFNVPYVIDDTYLQQGKDKWEKSEFNEYLRSVEFITVHYTGNMSKGANAKRHAEYFVNQNQPTSIHYNTGNDGIYLTLDNGLYAVPVNNINSDYYDEITCIKERK